MTRLATLQFGPADPGGSRERGRRGQRLDVGNVAQGIDLAGRFGASGSHHVLGGPENVTVGELLGLAGRIAGTVRRTIAVSPGAALAFVRLDALRARIVGAATLTPGWIRAFLEYRPVDVTRTRAELGYRPRSLETGLARRLGWLRDGGRRRNGGPP